MSLNTVTIHGNLTEVPQLQFTHHQGVPVATAVVLVKRRVRVHGTDDEWADATPTRHRIKAWRRLGENLATLEKGAHVLVVGHVETDTYEHDGQTRYVDTVIVDAIGASLAHATVQITKNPRTDTAPASS